MTVEPAAPSGQVHTAPVALRDGTVDDLDAVMAVMTRAFPPCFGEAWTRSQCAGIMPMHGVSLRLAERDGQPATGFSLARIVADEAELLLIAVAPDAQGGGTGRLLLDDFVTRSLAAGASHLHLEVREGNPAVALYASSGFEEAGRRVGYYRGRDGQVSDAMTLVRRA